jgi:membrane metallo-endopeptidase-like protein 1
MNWFNFTNSLLQRYNSSETIKNDDTIVVLGYEYFQNLTNLLNEYNSTDETRFAIKFSMFIHLLKFSLPLISSEYRAQLNVLNEALTGASLNERWQQCIDHVDSTTTLGFAVGRMFVRKKFNKAKSTASDMIKRIRNSFTANFPSVSWMDEETRIAAEDKIQGVNELIGYPDYILNDLQLNEKYWEVIGGHCLFLIFCRSLDTKICQ